MNGVRVPVPKNDDVERLCRVVGKLIAGDIEQAAAELGPIARLTCVTKPIDPMPSHPRQGWPLGTGAKTKSPPTSVIAGVYVRDAFTCSYCGRRTVPTQLLRLLSQQFGDSFPYHANWKKSATHRAYWEISTTLDHVVPVSGDGEWNNVENLATACARCQYQKATFSLQALGWSRTRGGSEWDGLTFSYEALWETLGRPPGNYATWVVAFNGAWASKVG